MLKNFKGKPTIKTLSLEAMLLLKKFGWIANISKPNKTINWKQSFFGPFRVLYLIGKQAYKLELSRKLKIYDVFHVSLLEQDTIRKGQVDKKVREIEFDASDNDSEEYEVEVICDSTVYTKKLESGYLPSLHYLVAWKGYLKKREYLRASFSSSAF